MNAANDQIARRVLAQIDSADLTELASSLVAAGGENPGGTEQRSVAALAAACESRGFAVELTEVSPGRQNLVATLDPGNVAAAANISAPANSAPANSAGLMFLGHSDVVPAGDGWHTGPFAPVVRDGRLYGRGTADMKGGLAAVITAMDAFGRASVRLAGPLQLVCTVDEEDLGTGIRSYVQTAQTNQGVRFAGCVVAEPTDLRTVIGCRGDSYLALRVRGKAAHSGRPDDGSNAIAAAAKVLQLVQEDHELLGQTLDPLLGCATWSIGTIAGGTGTSIVAAECSASIDRRLMPGEDARVIADELLARVRAAGIPTDGISVEITVEMEMPGFRTGREHPLVQGALGALTDAGGAAVDVAGWSAACEGGFIARDLDIPCIVLGPGGLNDQAHQPNESVGVDELAIAARAYALLVLRMVGAAH